MNNKYRSLLCAGKEYIAVVLAFVMIFNLSGDLFAQALSAGKLSSIRNQAAVLPHDFDKTFSAQSTRVDKTALRLEVKLATEHLNDPSVQRAMQIKRIFFPEEFLQKSAVPGNDYELFAAQYVKEINEHAQNAVKELLAKSQEQKKSLSHQSEDYAKDGISAAARDSWLKEAEEELNKAHQDSLAQISAWKQQSLRDVKKNYQAFREDFADGAEKVLRSSAHELMDLFKKQPLKVSSIVLEVSPAILLMRNEGLDLFTQQEKAQLHTLYVQVLQKGSSCLRTTPRTQGLCNAELSALVGLGIIGQGREDASVIGEFVERHAQAAASAVVLVTGASALLAMKEYDVLRGLLNKATEKESDLSTQDILSTGYLVEGFKNMNGHYLGESSKYMQYNLDPVETVRDIKDHKGAAIPTKFKHIAKGNAWEDVAHMLAAEGSAKSLSMLKEFGVDKCSVLAEKKLDLQTKYSLVCTGLQPFLAGAIISGKSGVEQYAPYRGQAFAGIALDRNGNALRITKEEAARAQERQHDAVGMFNFYAQSLGLPKDALIARHLFLKSMGDLDAETEQALDAKLGAFFAAQTKGVSVRPELQIKPYGLDSAEYFSKVSRQDRAEIWTTVSAFADFAILIWCAYDLVKLGTKGVAMGRSIYKSVSMARTGATVMQRGLMLRRLNTVSAFRGLRNANLRVLNGMKPLVLEQSKLFTFVAPKPHFGEIKSVGQALAQSVEFSAETGILSINAARAAEASGNASAANVPRFAQLLGNAATQTNKQFANQTGWRKALLNNDQAYRSVLSKNTAKELAEVKFSRAERPFVSDLLLNIKTDKTIAIPASLESFKNPALMESGASGLLVNSAAVRSVAARALGIPSSTNDLFNVEQAFSLAITQANRQFASRNIFMQKISGLLGKEQLAYRNILANQFVSVVDNISVFSTEQKLKLTSGLAGVIRTDRSIAAPSNVSIYRVDGPREKVKYQKMGSSILSVSDPAVRPQEMPLNVMMDRGIKGVELKSYQRIMFTDKDGSYIFGVSNGLATAFKPNNFKITIPSSDIPLFIRAVDQSAVNTLEMPFSLKLVPLKKEGLVGKLGHWFGRSMENTVPAASNRFVSAHFKPRDKNNIYIDDVNVFLRLPDGALKPVPLRLKADYFLNLKNARMVLERNGELQLYKEGKLLSDHKLFSYGLQKKELKPFLNIIQNAELSRNLNLRVNSSRGKMLPLYIATGLSLSSASTSLIAPLENTYGDRITETDKVLISLALPYIPSMLTPLLSPVVMKFGALKTVKIALLTSTVGLGFAWSAGFSGKVDKSHLPPLWPLFVSGAAIGVSSALSRSGLNLLIDSIGGGGGLLKSMAAKNIGSFALLVPPLVWSAVKGEPGASDFSLAFPVLSTLSAASLASLYFARIDPSIGVKSAFMSFNPLGRGFKNVVMGSLKNTGLAFKSVGQESWSSVRILASKELLPLTLAAFTFTGFEAAAFSKASNQLIRPEVKDMAFIKSRAEKDRDNWVALVTSGTVVAFPLLTRLAAKPTLSALSSPLIEGIEYKRMLGLSFALNLAGSTLLMQDGFNGFTSKGFLGIGLMGLGTANVTQSLQKLSNVRVLHGAFIRKLTAGRSGLEVVKLQKEFVAKAMTVFPISQTGLAIVPLIVGSYSDEHVRLGVEPKADVSRSSLWIPISSLGLSAMFTMPSLIALPKLATGLLGTSKLLFGSYPAGVNHTLDLWKTTFSPAPTAPVTELGPVSEMEEPAETELTEAVEATPGQ